MKKAFRITFGTAAMLAQIAVAAPATPRPATPRPATPRPVPRTVTLTEADNGKQINLHAGDTLVVTLSDPGDGGYAWNYLWDEHSFLLKILPFQHTPFQQPQKGPRRVGNFGLDVYRFVVNPGKEGQGTYVRFLPLRSFDKSVTTENLWQIRVDVE